MTFSNNIKNKNMLEYIVNIIHKLTGIEKEQIINVLYDKQSCKGYIILCI